MEHLTRLQSEVAAAQVRAWRWGEHDCATFAARAAGVALPWRWGTAREAMRLLRALGGMAAGATALWGAPVSPLRCGPGALVVHAGALGVVVDHRAAFAAHRGLSFVPLASCDAGWVV